MSDAQSARREREARWRSDPIARERDARAYRRALFVIASGPADPPLMKLLLDFLRATASNDERARWDRWAEALATGRRVALKTYATEFLAGDALAVVELARVALADDEAIASEIEAMR